jgi:hypothetical protein
LDNINNTYKVNINNWVITQLDLVQILAKKAKKVLKKLFISLAYKEKNPLPSYYLKESQKIA